MTGSSLLHSQRNDPCAGGGSGLTARAVLSALFARRRCSRDLFFKQDSRVVGYDKRSDYEGSALESVASLSMTAEWSATINVPTMKALPLSHSLL